MKLYLLKNTRSVHQYIHFILNYSCIPNQIAHLSTRDLCNRLILFNYLIINLKIK